MANDVIEFRCPECKRHCRLSQRQRAVQHEVPECKTWLQHKRAGDIQEFLRLALMSAGGAAFNLGAAVIGATPNPLEYEQARAGALPSQHREFSDKEHGELIEELNEGLSKL